MRAVARYEAAVRILIRCWSENLSQGKLTGMAFPRVGLRSTAFRASLPGHATELSPKLFQGAEILAVKGDVVPFFAEGSSGPFDLGNFRGTGGEAAVTTPCQPLGMARVEVLTLDGEVTAVAKRPGEYFAEWRAELELARARREADGRGAWTTGPGSRRRVPTRSSRPKPRRRPADSARPGRPTRTSTPGSPARPARATRPARSDGTASSAVPALVRAWRELSTAS